jgi:hypothetical protein
MFNFNSSSAWGYLVFGGWLFSNLLKPWPTIASTLTIGGFFLIAYLSKLNLKSIKKGDLAYMHISEDGCSLYTPTHVRVISILPNDKVKVETINEHFNKILTIPISNLKTHI